MKPELKIKAIENGTVIDHITANKSLHILKILGLPQDEIVNVTVAMNVVSRETGRKDIVKINMQLLEQEYDINHFKNSNPIYIRKNQNLRMIKTQRAPLKKIDIDVSEISSISLSLFNNDLSFFIEQGVAESKFFSLIENYTPEQKALFEKRIDIVSKQPEAIGKVILASTKELMKNKNIQNDLMQIYFILFTRYYFNYMFQHDLNYKMLETDLNLFSNRVTLLRKLTPIGFGISQNFLPVNLKSIQIEVFPVDNPYKESIGLFSKLPYYYCPLDFCYAVHEALKTVQNVASQISFEQKAKQTGKIYAKSDHLLCLDDLFDISLIVFLLGNPIPVFGIVQAIEPYIKGLEMTSELEFAYTNISAIIKHISEIDIDTFVQDAHKRTEQSMEIDPLNILK